MEHHASPRFPRWSKVVNAVGNLILVAQKRHRGHHRDRALDSSDSEKETTSTISVTEARVRARKLIIRNLHNDRPKTFPLIYLTPFLTQMVFYALKDALKLGRQFRLFVANRIGEIQNSTDSEQWQYISIREHPADLCCRGSSAQELVQNEEWWNGPSI